MTRCVWPSCTVLLFRPVCTLVAPSTNDSCSLRALFCCPPEPAFDCWKLFPLTAVWSPTVFVLWLLSMPPLPPPLVGVRPKPATGGGAGALPMPPSWTVLLFRPVWMLATPATIEPCSLRAWFCWPPEPVFDCWKLFPLTAVWSPTVFVFPLLSLLELWSTHEHFLSYVGFRGSHFELQPYRLGSPPFQESFLLELVDSLDCWRLLPLTAV